MSATLQRDWLSPSQAANRLGCSPQWVRILAKEGRLGSLSTPLGTLVNALDVAALAAERAAKRGGADVEPQQRPTLPATVAAVVGANDVD